MVCLLLHLVLTAGTVLIVNFRYKITDDNISAAEQAQYAGDGYSTPLMTDPIPRSYEELSASSRMLSFFSGESALLLAVVISLFAGGEFTHGTIRNLASRGYSRNRIYASKFMVSMLVSILFAALSVLTAYTTAVCLRVSGTTLPGFAAKIISWSALELILNAVFAAIFLMSSILIRQSGGSLAVNICFSELFFLLAMTGELPAQELAPGLLLRILSIGSAVLILTAAAGTATFARRDIY